MNKYPSRYSINPDGTPKDVTAAQYIAELICEKRATSTKRELPIRFWVLEEWAKYYKYQIMLANKLLKQYRDTSIVKALLDSRSYKTFSLNSPFLIHIIKEYNNKPEPKPKKINKININAKPTNPIKDNIVSRLKKYERDSERD